MSETHHHLRFLEIIASQVSSVTIDETRRDHLTFCLAEAGFDTFSEDEGGRLHAFGDMVQINELALSEVLNSFATDFTFAKNEIADRDWNEEWEKNYHKPVEVIPGEVVIRASFHAPRPDLPFEIIIDPKMAFGTGSHDTTAGMMRLLHSLDLKGKSVIDMGCGSGVLGIYALMKGASSCVGVDIDEHAVANAVDNGRVNHVPLAVKQGDAAVLASLPKVDLFMANITRNIILRDLNKYLSALNERGILLLSGFLSQDLAMMEEALDRLSMKASEVLTSPNGWIALKAVRNRARQ